MAELREALSMRMPVLDIRAAERYAAGHIAGSINPPLGSHPLCLAAVPSDWPLVVHSQGGTRSTIAASIMTAQGRPTTDLQGGFNCLGAGRQACRWNSVKQSLCARPRRCPAQVCTAPTPRHVYLRSAMCRPCLIRAERAPL